MAKNPKIFNCHTPTPYQVRFVIEFTPGTAPRAFNSHARTKAIEPKAMNFPGAGFPVCEWPCPQVFPIFTITASAVMTVNTVPTVLSEGIHAGTGAEDGTPDQVANKTMVQNVNAARWRLYSGRFSDC